MEPLELWKTPPFEPTEKDGKLYARGACDDKGQVYMHLSAIEAHLAVNKRLPINLKLVIEGEEEAGSESLEGFLVGHRKELDANVILVSDTGMLSPDQPALTYALRGILYTQIEVTGPSRDLHSGEFGGSVMNPANALATIIAGLRDADGHITVPGFYEKVRELTPLEREAYAAIPFDEKGFIAETGAPVAYGEKGRSTLERIWSRPTCDVNGMWSGYTGEGSKTVGSRGAVRGVREAREVAGTRGGQGGREEPARRRALDHLARQSDAPGRDPRARPGLDQEAGADPRGRLDPGDGDVREDPRAPVHPHGLRAPRRSAARAEREVLAHELPRRNAELRVFVRGAGEVGGE